MSFGKSEEEYQKRMVSKRSEIQDFFKTNGPTAAHSRRRKLTKKNKIGSNKTEKNLLNKYPSKKVIHYPTPPINTSDNMTIPILNVMDSLIAKGVNNGIFNYIPTNHFIFLGYLYLKRKYNCNCNFIVDETDYDSSHGLDIKFRIDHKSNDLLLSMSTEESKNKFDEFFEDRYPISFFLNELMFCIKITRNDTVIVPIIVYFPEGHSNILIYRKKLHVLEHYEPHGNYKNQKETDEYKQRQILYQILEYIVKEMNQKNEDTDNQFYETDLKYISPNESCATAGFQSIENMNFHEDEEGFCILWTLFFAELALMNPEMTSLEIHKRVINEMRNISTVATCNRLCDYFKLIIYGYGKLIYDIFDAVLVTINESPVFGIDDFVRMAEKQMFLESRREFYGQDPDFLKEYHEVNETMKTVIENMNEIFSTSPEMDFDSIIDSFIDENDA